MSFLHAIKKTPLWAGLAVLLLSLLVPFLAIAPAHAADGTWIDFAHIEVNGTRYVDSRPRDDNINFRPENTGGDCRNEIRGFSTGNILNTGELGTAELVVRTEDPFTSECTSVTEVLNLSNTANSLIWFYWVDEDRVQGASSGTIYNRVPGTDDFAQTTDSSCKNRVTASSTTPDANNTTGATFDDAEPDFPDGCNFTFSANIRIGNADNASLEGGTGNAGGVGPGGGADLTQPSCESTAGEFAWALCPMLRILDSAVSTVDSAINGLLVVDYDKLTETGSLRNAWSRIRNVGYILLIPIMLVMVIGTALGFSFIDAYTVRRALPRMIVAVIFMALSWDITRIMIDATNIVGQGLAGLIGGAIRPGGITELQLTDVFGATEGAVASFGSFAVIGGILAAAWATGLIFPLIGILGLQMLAVFGTLVVAFALLAARQMIIFALVLVSPLAILSWIFPGNDGVWKLWWTTFTRLLLLFPVIVILVVTGKAFAFIINEVGGADNAGGLSVLLDFTLKFAAYIGPYFFIPAAFRFAGGVFSNLAGMANDRSRGFFDRNRKKRQEIRGKAGAGLKDRALKGKAVVGSDEAAMGGRANKTIQKLAHLKNAADGGLGGMTLKDVRGNVRSAIATTNQQQLEEMMEKDEDVKTFSGNDDVTGVVGDVMNADKLNLTRLLKRKAESGDFNGDVEATVEQILKLQQAGKVEDALRLAFESTNLHGNQMEAITDDDTEETIAAKQASAEAGRLAMNTDLSHVLRAKRKYGDRAFTQAMVLKAMGGGTYYEDSSDTWRAAGLAAGDDQAAQAYMNVKGRSILTGAGRVFEGGGSFGTTLGMQKNAMLAESEEALEKLQDKFQQHVIDNNPMSTLLHSSMKPKYAEKNLIPALQQRLFEAAEAAQGKGQDSEEYANFMAELANMDAGYQMLKQTKPDIAKLFGRDIMSMQLPEQNVTTMVPTVERVQQLDNNPQSRTYGQQVTVERTVMKPQSEAVVQNVQQSLETYQADPVYQQFSKEFVSSNADNRARQAAQQAASQQPQDPSAGPGTPANPGLN